MGNQTTISNFKLVDRLTVAISGYIILLCPVSASARVQCVLLSLARQGLKEGGGLLLGHVPLRQALDEDLGSEAVEELLDVVEGDVEDRGVLLAGLPERLLYKDQGWNC